MVNTVRTQTNIYIKSIFKGVSWGSGNPEVLTCRFVAGTPNYLCLAARVNGNRAEKSCVINIISMIKHTQKAILVLACYSLSIIIIIIIGGTGKEAKPVKT